MTKGAPGAHGPCKVERTDTVRRGRVAALPPPRATTSAQSPHARGRTPAEPLLPTATAAAALLPTPPTPGPYAWTAALHDLIAMRPCRRARKLRTPNLAWLPHQIDSLGLGSAYDHLVQCAFLTDPMWNEAAAAAAAVSEEASPDVVFTQMLRALDLSAWINQHPSTCGHVYHVPRGADKERRLMKAYGSETPMTRDWRLPVVSVGGCTVCWKLACVRSQPLRLALNADWLFVHSSAAIASLTCEQRVSRFRCLYLWLYALPHFDVWAQIASSPGLPPSSSSSSSSSSPPPPPH